MKQCSRLPQISIITTFPTKEFLMNYVACFAVNIIVTLSTISLNLLTVLAYWKSSQLNKKISYFLIMIISLSDFAVGICSTSFLVVLTRNITYKPSCLASASVRVILDIICGLSLEVLFILNLERYLSIVHPFFHRKHVTKRRLLVLIVVLFVIITTKLTIPTFVFAASSVTSILTGIDVAFVLFILVYLNSMIFFRSRKRVISNISNTSERKQEKEFLRKLRLAKLCVIVVGGTILCYLPLAVCRLVDQGVYEKSMFGTWGVTFVLASSSLNSVIFFWRNPILRKEAKRTLCN